jgi:hypothetical protein
MMPVTATMRAAMAGLRQFTGDELAVLVGIELVEAGSRGLDPFGAGDLAVIVAIGAAPASLSFWFIYLFSVAPGSGDATGMAGKCRRGIAPERRNCRKSGQGHDAAEAELRFQTGAKADWVVARMGDGRWLDC